MIESPEQLHRAFQDAFNRHDVDAIVALYESGAVLASADGPVHGIDAIRDRYRVALANTPSIELQTLDVTRAGTLAMLHGKWIVREAGPAARSRRSNCSIASGWSSDAMSSLALLIE